MPLSFYGIIHCLLIKLQKNFFLGLKDLIFVIIASVLEPSFFIGKLGKSLVTSVEQEKVSLEQKKRIYVHFVVILQKPCLSHIGCLLAT